MGLSRKIRFIISTVAFGLPIAVAISWNVIFNLVNKEASITPTFSLTQKQGSTYTVKISLKFNKKVKGGKVYYTWDNDQKTGNSEYLEVKDGEKSASNGWFGKSFSNNPKNFALVTKTLPAYWSTGTLFISLVSIIPAPAFVIDTIKFAKERKEVKKALEHQKEDAAKANSNN